MSERVGKRDLTDLRRKYEEIRRLRALHSLPTEPNPRAAMTTLAGEFPGALRELDDMPDLEVGRRIDELDRALAGEGAPPLWAVAVSLFHTETRGALCAKRWLAGRRQVSAHDRVAFEAAAGAFCYVSEALAWANDLEALAAPPKGRITELVYARIARDLSMSLEETKELVFAKRSKR